MRLFVAIELEPEVRASIAREQKRLAGLFTEGKLRWVRPEQIHLTLAFIGETASDRVPAIVDAMTDDIPQAQFRLALGGLGAFPSNKAPRVLWIGVVEGAREVADLQREVARRLEDRGVSLEERTFRPHLTIGRWQHGRPMHRSPPVSAEMGTIEAGTVRAATLFESRLSSSGATHIALAKAHLREG